MFEVENLQYATLATVSRCGMVWFSNDVVTVEMCFENYFRKLREIPLDATESVQTRPQAKTATLLSNILTSPTADLIKDDVLSSSLQVLSSVS